MKIGLKVARVVILTPPPPPPPPFKWFTLCIFQDRALTSSLLAPAVFDLVGKRASRNFITYSMPDKQGVS